ncbi:MAG: cysteine protease StiP family protein [Actinomycetota bacterium]|nr:cysteine protease StiP family protein [Actinomycetota bacterium]
MTASRASAGLGNCAGARAVPLRGPEFGTYAPGEVAWLLTDLSGIQLEAAAEERESQIQSGAAHYAESLPIEYQPGPEYQQLFDQALARSAYRVAVAVGVVTEQLIDERGHHLVLASLARAGTPIAILMRRWARYAHQVELPHYAVSIVRGRGIDQAALAYLADNHRSGQVVFVDGWTGKGAIARELGAAVTVVNRRLGAAFSSSMAVLADTGSCVDTFGTREDFLIPSACLNSTVSGLVSRTVLNARLMTPGSFHGAKYYRSLKPADVSARFLDAVSDQFDAAGEEVERQWRLVRDGDRRPTWEGWRAVEAIAAAHGLTDLNLIKPGVGETTRVLLRRIPWRVLVRRGEPDLAHVLLLAQERGVSVVEVDRLAYSCVGIIKAHPGHRDAGAAG